MPMPKKQAPKKTNRLNEVTSVSKLLAAILFIVLPFVAAYIGYVYYPIINTF